MVMMAAGGCVGGVKLVISYLKCSTWGGEWGGVGKNVGYLNFW